MDADQEEVVHFKARELTLLQKIAQAYWANPKSWLLDELMVEGGTLTIVRKNGDRFEAPLCDVEATFAVDNYDRREVNVCCGAKKTRFKEIPGMLSEEEWDALIAMLNPRKSGLGKVNDALRTMKDKLGG